ncbi:putative HD hydrolase with response regulator receiver domain protein [Rheinheimera sp. A13L]|uniref:HDOD domain-containing protein n=1 Tax=Rheinheimera sp. A13L TaxID=506534 RepID=UPI0002124D55|nr:HDOD domain-containing protein [Rheinheimera sp. A13L]EGM78579.1 putative HD hydrolase with response regulator receiver domain protein [Rheinheimera sp. A13L]
MVTKEFLVLLIDDEELILRALKRTLSRLVPHWKVETLQDGHLLTEVLSKGLHPDVVITDRLMPGLNGEQLLLQVQQICPMALRCILTADNSADLLLQNSALIHFYLAKPFTDEQLLKVFSCTEQLQTLDFSNTERAFLGRLCVLPVLPPLYQKIQSMLNTTEFQLKDVAELISHDPVVSSRILQLANSAFLGFSRSTVSLTEAISRLGLDMTKSIVLALKSSLVYQGRISTAQHQRITEQAFHQACMARYLCKQAGLGAEMQDYAFLVSLFGCLGWMAEHLQQPSMSDEDSCHFSMISAYLLTLWGFEHSIVQAVILPEALADCSSLSGVVHWLAHKVVHHKNYQLTDSDQHIVESLQLYPAWTELLTGLKTG